MRWIAVTYVLVCALAAEAAPRAAEQVSAVLAALERAGADDRACVLGWLAEVKLRPLDVDQLEALTAAPTDPRAFPLRVALLRGCLARRPMGRAVVDHLLLEYHVNAVQASRRLDRCAQALAVNGNAGVEALRASLPPLPVRGDARLLSIVAPLADMLAHGRAHLAKLDPAWESELDATVDAFKNMDWSDRDHTQRTVGEALLLRDRDAQDPGLAHVLLAQVHSSPDGTSTGLAMAALGAGLSGRDDAARRLFASALANPVPPIVHLWAAVSAAADPAPDGPARFRVHLRALSGHAGLYASLLRIAPVFSIMERGGDVAMAMLAQGGRKDCPPALLSAWTAAIELDAAPLAALELALCCALPRARANALLEKI